MMKTAGFKKILEHPDREEILSKLCLDYDLQEMHTWLKSKYSAASETKYVISVSSLQTFKDQYLDFYNIVREDMAKVKNANQVSTEEQLQLAVQGNSTYKKKIMEMANKEIDVRKMIATLCVVIEERVANVFDTIVEDPRNINTKIDRLLIDYAEVLGNILDKYHKFTEMPTSNNITNNVTVQIMDQHMNAFHSVVKEVLSSMDLEASLYFMELYSEKVAKLKAPTLEGAVPIDVQMTEIKQLNDTINNKLNETN